MANTKVQKKPNFLFDGSSISDNFMIFFFPQQASLFSSRLYYILDTLWKCNNSRTLQQCLQQRRRNASLQQLYNI